MSLQIAIQLSMQLRDTLADEVKRSRDARAVLKRMQIAELLVQAADREGFNQRSAMLSDALAKALGDAAVHRLKDITLDQLNTFWPFEGAQLSSVFGEIRSLTAALAELDAFNHTLAERALTFVRAYVGHLAPRPQAYGRRGAALAAEASTHSERA
jgi:hypothetical protein